MTVVAITQRVDITNHNERRDCLDQRWHPFLNHCGLTALCLPNDSQAAAALLHSVEVSGLILSGGNDLARFSGDAPERDACEQAMVEWFLRSKKSVLGVCRGMQFLADYYGCDLDRIAGHAGTRHSVRFNNGTAREVNSYHNYAVLSVKGGFQADALADDNSIEAMHHDNGLVRGIMWHPERETTPQPEDIQLFRKAFTS
jgi:gamma-glutamyl-gamma-aminobutyrate hydrolase PuuD